MSLRFPITSAFAAVLTALFLSGCFTPSENTSVPTPEGMSDEVPSSEIGVNDVPDAPPSVVNTPGPDSPVSDVPETSPYGAAFEESTIEELTKQPDAEPETPVNAAVEKRKARDRMVVRYVTASELSARAKPSTTSKRVYSLKRGDAVDVELKGAWARLDDGNWVLTKYLTSVNPKASSKSSKYRNLKLNTTRKKQPVIKKSPPKHNAPKVRSSGKSSYRDSKKFKKSSTNKSVKRKWARAPRRPRADMGVVDNAPIGTSNKTTVIAAPPPPPASSGSNDNVAP